MPSLQIIDSGPIYRNPNPGYQHTSAYFSHIAQISDQEIFCAYNQGHAMSATNLSFYQARSTDGGKTWGEHSLIYDGAQDDRPYSYHSSFLTRMRDGLLVIVAFRVDRSDPDHPIFNATTGGLTPLDLILLRSEDDGHTWSPPELLTFPDDLVITPTSDIVELDDGTWLLPFDHWNAFDDPSPHKPRTTAFFSTDKGKTWGDPVTFADGSAEGKGFWHGRLDKLEDGRLFVLFQSVRFDEEGKRHWIPLHYSYGSAVGRTWTEPIATNLEKGKTNDVAGLGDRRFLAIYSDRDSGQPGMRAVLSEDGGETWDLNNEILVWDATGRDRLGVSSPTTFPRSSDTIAFGAPTADRLLDGDVMVTFWCTEMSITHIRYARLRVKPPGA